MTSAHEMEPLIRDWLHDMLDAVPEPAHRYARIATEIQTTPQQPDPGPWTGTRRVPSMSSAMRSIAAVTVLALIGSVAYLNFDSTQGPADRSVTAPSSPPVASEAAGLPPIEPGTYHPGFRPSLTMTVPDGWLDDGGSDMFVGLVPAAQEEPAFLDVFRNLTIAYDFCIEGGDGRLDTASEMIGTLVERQGLTTSEPVAVTIGGLSGLQLDLAIAADWDESCPGVGTPWVPLVHARDFLWWGAAPGERFRNLVLDVAPAPSPDRNTTVSIVIYAADEAAWEDHLAASMAIVDSFAFDTSIPINRYQSTGFPVAGPLEAGRHRIIRDSKLSDLAVPAGWTSDGMATMTREADGARIRFWPATPSGVHSDGCAGGPIRALAGPEFDQAAIMATIPGAIGSEAVVAGRIRDTSGPHRPRGGRLRRRGVQALVRRGSRRTLGRKAGRHDHRLDRRLEQPGVRGRRTALDRGSDAQGSRPWHRSRRSSRSSDR